MTDRYRSPLVLAGFLLLTLGIGALGGVATAARPAGWYAALTHPPGTPPDGVFGPVWTLLYVLMAIAVWRVWRHREHPRRAQAFGIFLGQLVLNLLWSGLFFALTLPLVALLDLLVLWGTVAWMTRRFFGIDRAAGWLVVPYLAWAGYAGYLNAGIVWLN